MTSLASRKPSVEGKEEAGGETLDPFTSMGDIAQTAEKDVENRRTNRCSSLHDTPFQSKQSENLDVERKAMQLENFLGNLTLKTVKNNSAGMVSKSRDLNRIFLKRLLEPINERI